MSQAEVGAMWRNRARSVAIVFAGLTLLHGLVPDPAQRESWLYLVALPIGYGHLLGGLLFARTRFVGTPLEALFLAVSAITLLCAYTAALHVETLRFAVLAPMLLVSAWHIVENDLSLGCAYRDGLRLPGIPRARAHHAAALGGALFIGLLALATPTGAFYMRWGLGTELPWQVTTIPDLVTAVLMYHAVSWLLFFLDRAQALPGDAARRLRGRLLALHAIPLGVNAALYAGFESVYVFVASPTLYLFWSVLHAFQTAAARGLAPAAR